MKMFKRVCPSHVVVLRRISWYFKTTFYGESFIRYTIIYTYTHTYIHTYIHTYTHFTTHRHFKTQPFLTYERLIMTTLLYYKYIRLYYTSAFPQPGCNAFSKVILLTTYTFHPSICPCRCAPHSM